MGLSAARNRENGSKKEANFWVCPAPLNGRQGHKPQDCRCARGDGLGGGLGPAIGGVGVKGVVNTEQSVVNTEQGVVDTEHGW